MREQELRAVIEKVRKEFARRGRLTCQEWQGEEEGMSSSPVAMSIGGCMHGCEQPVGQLKGRSRKCMQSPRFFYFPIFSRKKQPFLLLELFGVQGIQLRLEFHDLESNLALHIHFLVIVEILEEIVIEIQALLNSLTSRLLVVVVIYGSTGFFGILELMFMPKTTQND